MENKNFEKSNKASVPGQVVFKTTWLEGYNTCLDRTNAKGLKEANIEAQKAFNRVLGAIQFYDDSVTKLIVEQALTKLETELKKAEQ